MVANYEPSSDFLISVLNDEAPLSDSEQAAQNLKRVIGLTRDADPVNRDWATFILGNLESDAPDVMAALIASAEDSSERVRAEAILGIARKDGAIALPYLERALAAESATVNIFEAAAIVAHPSLAERLRDFAKPSDDKSLDELIADALHACETGEPDTRYR